MREVKNPLEKSSLILGAPGPAAGENRQRFRKSGLSRLGALMAQLSLRVWPVRIGRGRCNETPLDRVRDLWGVREVKPIAQVGAVAGVGEDGLRPALFA